MNGASPRQLWKPPSAPLWNKIVAAAEYVHNLRLGKGQLPDFPHSPSDVVKVKNATGGDLNRGEVVQFTDFILENVPRNKQFWFEGKQPDPAVLKPYGVLLRPIPSNKWGPAQISGMCWAKIDKIYDDHPFVHIKRTGSKSSVLQTDWVGRGEIFYKEEIASQWWAAINLSNFQTTERLAVVREYGISGGGSAEMDVHYKGAITSPLQKETVHYSWMDGGNSALETEESVIRYFVDENKWRLVEKECS